MLTYIPGVISSTHSHIYFNKINTLFFLHFEGKKAMMVHSIKRYIHPTKRYKYSSQIVICNAILNQALFNTPSHFQFAHISNMAAML